MLNDPRPLSIAVVGAGISGLSAARALKAAGHDVIVFEKSRGPGGRVATREYRGIEMPRSLAGATLAFDHGAQYFTVRDDRFSIVVAEWLRDRVAAKWTGRVVTFDGEGWEDVDESTERYVGTPGMSALGAAMAEGLDVAYGHRVESLQPVLATVDHVILAIPPAEAATLVAQLPTLGGKVNDIVMKPSWTVMAAFEEKVAARFDAAFVTGSALGWIARNTSKPRRDWKVDAWVLQATTAWSSAHLDDRPDDVGAFLMEAFEDLVRAGLPRAFYATVHRWRYATADPPLAVGAIHDRDARITLCGDWCSGSRIEDAFLSGLAAADQISRSVNR
ncbi:MAG: NAD(P)/FAD-dependent oxidoreductase [Vicinamibacterales bacterium]